MKFKELFGLLHLCGELLLIKESIPTGEKYWTAVHRGLKEVAKRVPSVAIALGVYQLIEAINR
jgi:hypothetical protein